MKFTRAVSLEKEMGGGGGVRRAMSTTSFVIQVQGLVCEGKT